MTDRTLALNWWLGPSKNAMLNGSNIRSSTHHGKVDGFPDVLFRHIHDLLVKNIHYFFAQFCQCYWYICFNDPPVAKSIRMSLGWIQLLLCLRSVCWFGMVTFFQPCLIVQRSLVTNCKQRASLGPSKCEPVQRWSQVVTGKMHPTFRSVRWIGFSTNIYLRNPSWNAGKHALVMYLCPQTIAFFLINVSISIGLYSQNVFVLPLLPLLHG